MRGCERGWGHTLDFGGSRMDSSAARRFSGAASRTVSMMSFVASDCHVRTKADAGGGWDHVRGSRGPSSMA